jgi:hypothetical protein
MSPRTLRIAFVAAIIALTCLIPTFPAFASTCTISNAECSSKINAYDVMQFGVAGAINLTKAQSYIVMRAGPVNAISASKMVLYMVLIQLPAPTTNPAFHSFP